MRVNRFLRHKGIGTRAGKECIYGRHAMRAAFFGYRRLLMTDELKKKYDSLLAALRPLGRAAIAYSGGVDSTLLLVAAVEALGRENVLAVTAYDQGSPSREKAGPEAFCKERGIRHIILQHDIFAVEGLSANPPDRCYLCKKALFSEIIEEAKKQNIDAVCEGTNADDTFDFRPGMRAIAELGVRSPLKEAGLTKADIRAISGGLGLPTASAPSLACLASRFSYGEAITEKRLHMVDEAENFLIEKGFKQVRVRIQDEGRLARIEVPAPDIGRLAEAPMREAVAERLRTLGFTYVTLDLLGFRSGSMNETLSPEEKKEALGK